MATGKVVVGFFAVVVGSAVAMPPLTSLPDASGRAARIEPQTLTTLARIGQTEYQNTCASCHGERGQGGEIAPSLMRADLLDWPRAQRGFHETIVSKPRVRGPALNFNQIERIAKYLREIRRSPEA